MPTKHVNKALWANEERKKKDKKQAEEAVAPYIEEGKSLEDISAIERTSAIYMPGNALYDQVEPQKRKAAIAWAIGWKIGEIAKATKKSERTIHRWLNEDEVKLFLTEFQFQQGNKPIEDLVEKLQYSAVKTINEIMRDTTVSASTRANCAQWLYERKHGKAPQNVNTQINIAMKLLNASTTKALPESEVFDGVFEELDDA